MLGSLAVGACLARAIALSPGQSIEEVISQLGSPVGSIEANGRIILHFDNHTVHCQNDRVYRIDARVDDRISEQRRVEIAEQQYQNYLNHPYLLKMGHHSRLEFWQRFQHLHPHIDISHEILTAKHDYLEEKEARRLLAIERETLRQQSLLLEQQRINSRRYYSRPSRLYNHRYTRYSKPTQDRRKKPSHTQSKQPKSILDGRKPFDEVFKSPRIVTPLTGQW